MSLETSWPAMLCSLEHAAAIGVKLEVEPLAERFRLLAKKKPNMQRQRAAALRLIAQSGQIAAPPEGMSLWQFFKPGENVLINKGSLASKNHTLAKGRSEKRRRPLKRISRAATPPPPAPVARAAAAAAAGIEAAGPSLDDLLARALQPATLPGLLRGKAAGLRKGQGRGGALQKALKVGVRDLVTEDSVPIRDVPKVLLDMLVILTQQIPKETDLITHSHIRDWIVDLAASDLYDDWAEFWSVRDEFGPLTVLHLGHDGTRRADRKTGKHGELMQIVASYFNPRLKRAVEFIVSMRFTVGGSAPHTARAIAVNLADAGVYRVSRSPESTTAMVVSVLQSGVLFDLGTDNTGSAINVSAEMKLLTGEPCGLWPCPTHINALDGKTPITDMTGDSGKEFSARNAMNIAPKWWYVCDKHGETIRHWWHLLGCGSKLSVEQAMVKKKPLMGKWESVGAACKIIYQQQDAIRKFVTSMEYYATGMKGVGSLKLDCALLSEWMHDPELWFQFAVLNDWFERYIDPTFFRLRKRAMIYPESGCHMGGQMIPRLALDAIVRAHDLPDDSCSDTQIDAKVKRYFPSAHRHVHLTSDTQVGARNGFQIPSQDRQAYLRTLASKFTKRLRLNADKHWRGYLRGYKFLGLVTDPELGVYTARLIVKLLNGGIAVGGEPRALGPNLLGPNLVLQMAEIDAVVAGDGAGIAASVHSDGIYSTAAQKAEWLLLCDVARSASTDWGRSTLPELAPWLESRFFGRHRSNYVLESNFSVFGQHVEDEQAMDLKEAVVRSTKRLQREKDTRRAPEMRVPKKSAKAIANFQEQQAERAADGKTEELERDSETRKQLLMRGESLLRRMQAANVEGSAGEECSHIGKTRADFRLAREQTWDLLATREACLLEAEMRAMRAKPAAKAQLCKDPYGRVRSQMATRRTAAYLANALAANEAEDEAARAAEAARVLLMPTGDESDEDVPASPDASPTASPAKKKPRKGGRGRG